MIKTDHVLNQVFELQIKCADGAIVCMYFENRGEAEFEMRMRRPLVGETIKCMELNECMLYKTIRDCAL